MRKWSGNREVSTDCLPPFRPAGICSLFCWFDLLQTLVFFYLLRLSVSREDGKVLDPWLL